jgi:transcriptional regulator GlxA family with amidase domain
MHNPTGAAVLDERIRRAMLMMEQNLTDPIPIGDIAKRLKLSTRQLERLFHAACAKRPAEFYRELRLRYAHWLLKNTDRGVTDIALDAGFADCAHFSRQFKAAHGFAPSEQRSQSRRNREQALPPPAADERLAGFRVFG